MDYTFIGSLTKDPAVTLGVERPRVGFSIGSSDRYFKDGKWLDRPSVFFDFWVWGKRAEHAAALRLAKGDAVIVVARPRATEWTDEEGLTRKSTVWDVQHMGRDATLPRRTPEGEGVQEAMTLPIGEDRTGAWDSQAE